MSTAGLQYGFHHKRSFTSTAKAALRYQSYSGTLKVLLHCYSPINFLKRYVTGQGSYPVTIDLRTPIGPVGVTAFSPEDILTINEIFFWKDYGQSRTDRIVVDFGSNVGISSLYFLTRNPYSTLYCHEPLPQNIARLRQNLRGFEDRYHLSETAVAEHDGTALFGWEPTGRYGGIGYASARQMTVPAVDSNRILAEIVERHGEIDLLKIDIEGSEHEITARIPFDLARRIRRMAIELPFRDNPLPRTHAMHYRWPITTLIRRMEQF